MSDGYILVLGAGSSVEYGYPTGCGLVAYLTENLKIHLSKLKEFTEPGEEMRLHDGLTKEVDPFVSALLEARPNSIDSFLSRQSPKFDRIGRFALALAILNAEWRSGSNGFPSFHASRDNWQRYLFDRICSGFHVPNIADLSAPPIGILSFNYDRSLECAFHRYLRSQYPTAQANDSTRLLTPHHCYGRVRTNVGCEDYGGQYTFAETWKTADDLMIMYAGRDIASTGIACYEEHMARFDRVLFLGFGFDPFNLRVLKLPKVLKGNGGRKAYATAQGLTARQLSEVRQLFKQESIDITLKDCDCSSLLKEYV